MRHRIGFGACSAIAGLLACSSGSGPASSSPTASTNSASLPDAAFDPAVDCASGGLYQPDTYAASLAKPGSSGAITFVLASAEPAPPGVDSNTWVMRLVDATGAPIVDATFPTIKTWMPLHGHSSSVVPTATSNGDGSYAISLYLFMPGLWQITFDAQSGSQTDSAMFTFCVSP
jgi:hypothetical protein